MGERGWRLLRGGEKRGENEFVCRVRMGEHGENGGENGVAWREWGCSMAIT